MNTEDPIDSLLRSHFAGRLDRQRGRAAAFENDIARPATLAFDRSARRRPFRTASGIGLALAASVALGFTIPTVFRNLPGDGQPIGVREPGVVPSGTVGSGPRTNVTRNSWQTIEDEGPVMINPTTPGRRLVQRKVEVIRWTDADGKEHVEYLVPSEQRMVVEQGKQ